MNPDVLESFPTFTQAFEGKCCYMYLDVLGLVTTGIGNLIDPIDTALGLPWQKAGAEATDAEIRACWAYVKSRKDLCKQGGFVYGKLPQNDLRLTDEGIAALVRGRMQIDWDYLVKRFPDAEQWPSEAQKALLSMAWAMGPGFKFPKFQACALAQDWAGCATNCHMNETGNPGLAPRNRANVALFTQAAAS